MMPPYHGATIRVTELQIYDFSLSFQPRAIPSIQDLRRDDPTSRFSPAWREDWCIAYFKIEARARQRSCRQSVWRRCGRRAVGWREGITLFADLEAGATGAMTGGGYPDGMRQIVDAYAAGRREEALAAYERWLPLINYENRQCGLLACKALMKEGGIIACDAPRRPLAGLNPAVRAGLIETARRLNPMVLRDHA